MCVFSAISSTCFVVLPIVLYKFDSFITSSDTQHLFASLKRCVCNDLKKCEYCFSAIHTSICTNDNYLCLTSFASEPRFYQVETEHHIKIIHNTKANKIPVKSDFLIGIICLKIKMLS